MSSNPQSFDAVTINTLLCTILEGTFEADAAFAGISRIDEIDFLGDDITPLRISGMLNDAGKKATGSILTAIGQLEDELGVKADFRALREAQS